MDEVKHKYKKRIKVVPPLLRKEVLEIKPEKGDYLHGYMLNEIYAEEVIQSQVHSPGINMCFFWDKKNVLDTYIVNDKLSFHRLNDKLFIERMAGALAYATTAGFESVCEAMYLDKPVLMVPTHIEQSCNAFDAQLAGAGIVSEQFDLKKLIEYIPHHKTLENFVMWVRQADKIILSELECVYN